MTSPITYFRGAKPISTRDLLAIHQDAQGLVSTAQPDAPLDRITAWVGVACGLASAAAALYVVYECVRMGLMVMRHV